jgi:hypothetical protein
VARLESGCGDRVRAPVTQLGFGRTVGTLVYDSEVVQRVGEVSVKRAELCLLKRSRLTQFQLGGDIVAAGCGLIRRFDN